MTGTRHIADRFNRVGPVLLLAVVSLVGLGVSLAATGAFQSDGKDAVARDVGARPGGDELPPGVTVVETITFDSTTPESRLLQPGAKLPSGAECARRVRRGSWEPVLANFEANHTRGHRIRRIGDVRKPGNKLFVSRIDGNFTGTTDEILQWASCKWGIDTNSVRAQALIESSWEQAAIGDNGESFGIMQIKARFHPGTYPASLNSTAFNLDYALGHWRICYEGYFDWLPRSARGNKLGCIGLHFSGDWLSQAALDYVERFEAAFAERDWEHWPGQVGIAEAPESTTAPTGTVPS